MIKKQKDDKPKLVYFKMYLQSVNYNHQKVLYHNLFSLLSASTRRNCAVNVSLKLD